MEKYKAQRAPSVQDRFDDDKLNYYWTALVDFCQPADSLGVIGSDGRDAKLRKLWPNEPILAGILYTQQARLAAMRWKVKGPEEMSLEYDRMFQNLGYGAGWDVEVKKWTQDYTTQSRGALWEKGRQGKNGPVVGLAHLDISKCSLQPSYQHPVVYRSDNGNEIPLRREDVIHRCSMPSSMESAKGAGCCMVDRAMKAVQLLMALNKYEESALDDMPPDGIAAVSGMDWQTLEKAMMLWKQKKDSGDLTFKRVLWLCGNPMSTQGLEVSWTPFAEPPKDFNRREVIESYVKTLALDAGEDPNEFWLFVHTGATKGIGALLHEKGQGKGVVEMATVLERAFNSEVLPEGFNFEFDYRDRTAQKLELQRQESAIENVVKLWAPPMGKSNGMIPLEIGLEMLVSHEVITQDQAKRAGAAISDQATVTDTAVSTDRQGTTNETKMFAELLDDRLSDIRKQLTELKGEE